MYVSLIVPNCELLLHYVVILVAVVFAMIIVNVITRPPLELHIYIHAKHWCQGIPRSQLPVLTQYPLHTYKHIYAPFTLHSHSKCYKII